MKPAKTWQDVAAQTAVDYFLRLLDEEIHRLQSEIEAIYPELGRQTEQHIRSA